MKILKKALKKFDIDLKDEELEKLISKPKFTDQGDYTFPCFPFSEKTKMAPDELAIELREEIGSVSELDFDDVQTEGGYVNFFVNRKGLVRNAITSVVRQKNKYGSSKIGGGKKVVVELSSPNIAKPFGIGHLRSTIIGDSIANLSDFNGFKSIRINYLGDWGTQFGRLIFGIEAFGNKKRLEKDAIKYLLRIYVKASDKKYDEPSRAAFKRLEEGEKIAKEFWELLKKISLKEFEKVYETLGVDFDVVSSESDTTKGIPELMKQLRKKDLLVESEGALIVDLNKFGLGVAIIEKSDKTTNYLARDLVAAIKRYEKYKFEKMIYQVGQEQTLHFKQLFKILELLGYKWADNCIHSEHGLYLDKDGKKFATRKGKTIFMEDIIDDTKKLTSREIKKRWPKISKKELESRALKVAKSAIFYGDLKNNKKNNILFDLKKFTSFEGDTGPYLQYSYVRANSILNKAKKTSGFASFKIDELEKCEFELGKKISEFPETVFEAYEKLNPSIIASYAYELSQKFNEFYQICPVIESEQKNFRLSLVFAFKQTLENALTLLGIEKIEEM